MVHDAESLRLVDLYLGLFLVTTSAIGLHFALRNLRGAGLTFVQAVQGNAASQDDPDPLPAPAQHAAHDTRSRIDMVSLPTQGNTMTAEPYENSPLMMATLDERGVIIHVNGAAEEQSGFTAQDLIGRHALEFVHPAHQESLRQQLEQLLAEPGRVTHLEFQVLDKNGGQRWLEGSARSFLDGNGRLRVVFVYQDIGLKKQAETQLRLAEARYRALVEQIPAVVYTETFNRLGTQIYVSPQIEAVTGFTAEEWLADPGLWQARIHPEDRDAIVAEDERTNRTLEPYNVEYRSVRKDGEVIWLRDQAVLVRDEDGSPLYWQGILVDITEQKRVKEVILQSEERFSKAFHSSPIPTRITTWDDARLIDANPAYWDFSGYSPEEQLGHSLLGSQPNALEKHRRLLEQLRTRRSVRGEQSRFITRSGKILDVSVYHEIIRLDDVECVLSMFQDISEHKQAEDNLARKEAILKSIAFAADQFLTAPGWTANIPAILGRLGQAAEASRVYLFRASPEPDQSTLVSQMFEWCSPVTSPQIDNASLQHFDMATNGLGRWLDLLQAGKSVFGIVRELPGEEQAEFIREDILSIICVPILVSGQLWGFIGLDDCVRERIWSESEVEALQTAANLISAAIQRERAGDEAQKQLKELMMLHAAALASSTASDVDGLLASVTEILQNNLKPDNCGVLLLDESGRFLIPHASYHGNILDTDRRAHPVDSGVSGLVVSTGRARRIADVSGVAEFYSVSPGVRSELCVPIISGGEVTGVINLESRQVDAFDEADERLIHTIAGTVATAIQKLRLFEAERRRAREAEALREATTALTSSLDLNTLLSTTLDLLMDFAPYDSAWIEVMEDEACRIV
ncbi:MAG TPA: PAS domain S-box protein, partial [Anaerolineales bacterium]